MCDARDKPLHKDKHTDKMSLIEAGTDMAEETDHVGAYEEDAVFKGAAGPVHAMPLTNPNGFWVEK